jgi:hypothetical protein
VIPQDTGSLVEVSVFKEQEDLPRPLRSTAGAATFRNDGSLERRLDDQPGGLTRLIWYPMGRDIALEQTMLDDLQNRLGLPPGRGVSAVPPDAASPYYEPRRDWLRAAERRSLAAPETQARRQWRSRSSSHRRWQLRTCAECAGLKSVLIDGRLRVCTSLNYHSQFTLPITIHPSRNRISPQTRRTIMSANTTMLAAHYRAQHARRRRCAMTSLAMLKPSAATAEDEPFRIERGRINSRSVRGASSRSRSTTSARRRSRSAINDRAIGPGTSRRSKYGLVCL